jgi:type II secretory pathway pseudopilin PulG
MLTIKQSFKHNGGFSLIEVLIFITILGIFFINAIAVSIYTLKDMQVSQHRIVASRAAEEMNEWLASEKETDWNAFINRALTIANNQGGCNVFNDTNISWSYIACDSPPGNPLQGIYTRTVSFEVNSTIPEVTTRTIVTWTENRQTFTVPIDTVFSPWQ